MGVGGYGGGVGWVKGVERHRPVDKCGEGGSKDTTSDVCRAGEPIKLHVLSVDVSCLAPG